MEMAEDEDLCFDNRLLLSSSVVEEPQEEKEAFMKKIWSETKKLWRIAGPSIFSRLAMFSMTVITQCFAGHLSELDLAAISIATTVIISISFGFLLGMASALETLRGQAYGAKQQHILGIYLQKSWIILFIFAILFLPIFVFATSILKLIGTSDAVAEQSGVVAMWLIPFHFSFPFQFTLQRFLQSQLKTGVIACISGGALLFHLVITWVFVYGLRVGLVGTAITLDFSWWFSVLGLFSYVVYGGCPDSWTGFSSEALGGLWQFFKLSVASGFMLFLENFYYRVLIIVTGIMQSAEASLDALSVCVSILAWESMIPLGLLAGTGVRVANELGAGNAKGAKFGMMVSVLTSILVGIFFFSLIMGLHDKLAAIFTSSTSVISAVDDLAVFLAVTILMNSIQPVLSGVAVGCGWQALAALVNISSYYAVGVPLGVVLGWLFHFGIKGIWAGMIVGTVVQTVILSTIIMASDWENEAHKAQSENCKSTIA